MEDEIVETLHVSGLEVKLRPATPDDIPLLLSLIGAMASFEKLELSTTEESLRESLFGEAPAARSLLAFIGEQPVAYATWFFTFASMTGKRGLWLDDLFVVPTYRGKGIGRALMKYFAGIALRHRCARFEWMVLDWNEPAISFYKRLGATMLTNWRICRLDGSQLSLL